MNVSSFENGTATVTLPNDATGTVTLNINKTDYPYTITNGIANIKLPELPDGNYTYTITYSGDTKYSSANTTGNITINNTKPSEKINPNMNVSPFENGTATVTLPNDATGTVTLNINKTDYPYTITNGIANIKLPELPDGNYTYTITYSGDTKYSSANTTGNITINNTKPSEKINPNMKVIINSETCEIQLPTDAKGNVTLTINNKNYTYNITNGKVNIDMPKLEKGKYPYTVFYSGDEKYTSSTQSGILDVVVDIVTYISISKVDGDGIIEGILKDINGGRIADATLFIKQKNSNLTTKTSSNGVFSIKSKENGVITIIFEGKAEYLPSKTTLNLNIFPERKDTSIISEDYNTKAIDYNAGERGGYFTAKLVDGSGKILANKTVKIGFNGKVYTVKTNESGVAKLQINLANAGTYTFAVAFLGDDDYKGAFAVQKITVTKKTTSISASAKSYKASAKTKSYTVTLKTEKGSSTDGKTYLKEGKTVKLTVNGATYTAKTNSKGQATFKLSITKKGTYTATVNFAGDNTYQSSKATAKIKIN